MVLKPIFSCGFAVFLLQAVCMANQLTEPKVHAHWLSEPSIEETPNRVKRLAYEVYSGGNKLLSVDGGGEYDSGSWGPWESKRECSRTCGGGVLIEQRQCPAGEKCTGPNVRYVTCNVDPCADGKDYRAEQCSGQDDTELEGKYYKWKPFTKGKNKCELICEPEGENFYYKFADKVVDGTTCSGGNNNICVEGICLPVGCDGKLGSTQRDDECLVCGGDGGSCKTIEQLYDERKLDVGYHDIVQLPEGATSIRVVEQRGSKNHLAIRNATGAYLLNGGFQIRALPGNIDIAGTTFDYQKRLDNGYSYESIEARGPLTQALTIALVLQMGSKDSAVHVKYSVPIETQEYVYRPGEWTDCSVTCGKGVHTREISCYETATDSVTEDEFCDLANATSPVANRTCETTDCQAEWFEGPWEECSHSCGDLGWQYRVAYCHQVFADGRKATVKDSECEGERPAYSSPCNRFSCPEWSVGPWSACSDTCGAAHQYRSVTCRSEKEGEANKLLPAGHCDADDRAGSKRRCNLGPCDGLTYVTSDWKLCEKCNDTIETRDVHCQDSTGRKFGLEKCEKDNGDTPITERSCATPVPCQYQWHKSEWSECSTSCGHGQRTRGIYCAIQQLDRLEIMDESHCDADAKPIVEQNCTNEVDCTGIYYTSNWDECSVSCGGGMQHRTIICLNYEHEPVPELCDAMKEPEKSRPCNIDPCPTCDEGDFGCCPDNTTFALGEYNEGCSNCSLSEFGCCADNVTYAEGSNAKGCPEEALEGGMDSEEIEGIDADKKCNMTNEETGETVLIDCNTMGNASGEIDGLLNGDGNETLFGNETVHCSKTEFGCCPDWYTDAEGADNLGCPEFELGACNGTQYGCCQDEVTLARGENLEGCGDASCAATLYGCCKDRTTIAFGPHYKGCERSSFPCEMKEFGCCPDGETAALGKNGTGCGETCSLSKFGCCPDDITPAKGPSNAGCGCGFARYGCCPDGKTEAQGPGFYQCPETCAQSQFGCCPDGKTTARGSNKEGCPCQYTKFGCCPDGVTTALSASKDTCDDCQYSKYGCCPGSKRRATGPNNQGCPIPPTTTAPPVNATPERIASCSLPQDSGTPCGEYVLTWFYDTEQGACSQFWYGGCGGNDNRFASEQQCQGVCVDPPGKGVCYLPKIEGAQHCNELQARYWYDYNTQQCTPFWYRGCNGNKNAFAQFDECYAFCEGVLPPGQERIATTPAPVTRGPVHTPDPYRPGQHSIEDQQYCMESVDSGPCQDHQDLWYFDAFSGQCHTFIYGGCGGNFNRYQTQQQCQQRCGHLGRNLGVKDPQVCQLRVDRGHCSGSIEFWYFESTLSQCIPFSYSGCGGNENRFHTQSMCESLCIGERSAALIQKSPKEPEPKKDVCALKKDKGPCNEYIAKWWFDATKGTCQRFYYGGCKGNDNLFDTEEECRARCDGTVETCTLPKVVGPCSRSKPRFYFNPATNRCEAFTYGGCLGNSNNFKSEGACLQKCPIKTRDDEFSPEGQTIMLGEDGRSDEELVWSAKRKTCRLPFATGACTRRLTRFYYDWTTEQCRQFVYGGCGGNDNRFHTLHQCETECTEERSQNLVLLSMRVEKAFDKSGILEKPIRTIEQENGVHHHTLPTSIPPELCSLRVEAGACYSRILSWHYDGESGKCRSFFFTGCRGNANRFDSEEACDRACGAFRDQDVCYMASDIGDCEHSVNKWYYDAHSKVCQQMIYSGCGGNGNRFSSREECTNLCREEAKPAIDICTLEKQRGDCSKNERRFHYIIETQTCQEFAYSGCGGNENNFPTLNKCEQLCGAGKRAEAVCLEPMAHGPCTDLVTQWYYDQPTGLCKPFTWGGCRGSRNRFNDKHQCQVRCQGKEAGLLIQNRTEVCRLNFEHGPCTDALERWFHDFIDGTCKRFVYGGCEGNANQFLTEQRCRTACGGTTRTDKTHVREASRKHHHRHQKHHHNHSRTTASRRPPTPPPMRCVDDTRNANCPLIVREGLCDHLRYRRYCCRSCRDQILK